MVNEGRVDRLLRVAVGAVLLSLAFLGPHSPWGLIGVIPLATGLSGYCPAYHLFGFRTGR